MYNQEIVHNQTQKIYSHLGNFEIEENSDLWNEFQKSSDPGSLGYIFVETVASRLNLILEDKEDLT